METSDTDQVARMDSFRQASATLQLQGFKVETVLGMMNNCADKCELRYFESGVSKVEPGVECFTNCIQKSYKLSKGSFE